MSEEKRKRSFDDDDEGVSDSHHNPLQITTNNNNLIICSLPPTCNIRPVKFSNSREFESHYRQNHASVCLECRKRFPSRQFLDLHITENHDPFAMIQRDERGIKIYACLVPDCVKLCSCPYKRRLHLIDKHGYPKNYDFNIIERGLSPHQTSLLR